MTSADQLEGLDLAALDGYLRSLGIDRDGELRAQFISGGRSNLTFRVYDEKTSWLVRRPPLHGLTPSAHDMGREYKVVAALQDTPVPVARTIALCDDAAVLGAPFQIVEFVAGQVVRRRAQLESLGRSVIDGCVNALIRVLVDLHSVDPNAVGLGDFGKPSGYLERQVRRWGSQWELVRLPDDHRDADVYAAVFGSAAIDSAAEPDFDRARRLPDRQHHPGRGRPDARARGRGLGALDAGGPDQSTRP